MKNRPWLLGSFGIVLVVGGFLWWPHIRPYGVPSATQLKAPFDSDLAAAGVPLNGKGKGE